MVKLLIDSLQSQPDSFEIHHVNARFSSSLEDIGESSFKKGILIAVYVLQAILLRFRVKDPLLYYVPGPVKWSAVMRDWIVLSILRIFYRHVVFHWHAIGQGEWACGSSRLALDAPSWVDRLARRISEAVLGHPHASIAVSESSTKDTFAVQARHSMVLPNGIEDPCPDYESELREKRANEARAFATGETPRFRILYLSHGTIEKGLFDAIDAIRLLVQSTDPSWCFAVTLAGGVSESLQNDFTDRITQLKNTSRHRLSVEVLGYLRDEAKSNAYRDHDIFLAPSHWESFGLTVLEAMAHGMRVVAAASDGVKGVLPPGHPYLSVPANPDSLAKALSDCCHDLRSGVAETQGESLRQRFLSTYQLSDFSTNLRACMAEMALRADPPVSARNPVGREPRPVGKLSVRTYLADQNPGHDRSYGISRMSQVVIEALAATGEVELSAIVSKTSQQAPAGVHTTFTLPWGSRGKPVRLLTDHFHPLVAHGGDHPSVHYFPKGYLPLLHTFCSPSVVTIHDTIIQYDEDRYPTWRKPWEYSYWAWMLKHTLRSASQIMTVSESSRKQILDFMERHGIPAKRITVTYEPCLYESIPQPESEEKEHYVIHLASCEPHKRTTHLIKWWSEAENEGLPLPTLHLIGTVPPEVGPLLAKSRHIVKRPFLEDTALQDAYRRAKALILPSEIEGFGLPALEAYYLGTPVCFVKGTSVDEILSIATPKGGFQLDSRDSLFAALNEVLAMTHGEVRKCGLILRETYASRKVAERMLTVFRDTASVSRDPHIRN